MHKHEKGGVCHICNIEESYINYINNVPFWKDDRVILIIISSFILFTGLVIKFIFKIDLVTEGLFLLTAIILGYEVAKESILSLIYKKRLIIDFLITIAVIGSFFIGHGEEGAAVIYLFYIAKFLESKAGERAARSILSLMKLAPYVATVKRSGKEVTVPVEEVDVNEIIVVRPGEENSVRRCSYKRGIKCKSSTYNRRIYISNKEGWILFMQERLIMKVFSK